MRFLSIHQTLAILVASVCVSTPNAYATQQASWQLTRDLYAEQDWHHAHIEAVRLKHQDGPHAKASAAIAHLAALHMQPDHTEHYEQLQTWLTQNTDNSKHDWVMTEIEQILSKAPSTDRTGITGFFARMLIGFYQTQIGPALGQRCAMYPSCSHYALEACRQYGLAGIPMTTDRIIRESDHIRHRINPIQKHGRELYYDPVKHHTYWFRRYRK